MGKKGGKGRGRGEAEKGNPGQVGGDGVGPDRGAPQGGEGGRAPGQGGVDRRASAQGGGRGAPQGGGPRGEGGRAPGQGGADGRPSTQGAGRGRGQAGPQVGQPTVGGGVPCQGSVGAAATAMQSLSLRDGADLLCPPQKRVASPGCPEQFPGKAGRPVSISVNHFKVACSKKVLYMYNIDIKPPWTREYRKRDMELYFKVVMKWKKICPEIKKNEFAWVYNGHAILYSTQDVPAIKDIEGITLEGDNGPLEFDVRNVRRVQVINVNEELNQFQSHGRKAFLQNQEGGVPQSSLNALDNIMAQAVKTSVLFTTVGRSYFHNNGEVLDVGFGKEVWIGTFSSIRPYGWKGYLMTLNVDVCNKPATVSSHLVYPSSKGARDSYIEQVLNNRRSQVDLSRGLDWRQIEALEKDLKGLKVRYELPNGNKRVYKVNKIVDVPSKLKIPDLGKTVQEYFKEEHKTVLKFPQLPCLHLGAIQKTIYIPVEFCSMENQPMPRGKKLGDDSIATMIRGTAVKPQERQRKILEGLQKNNEKYKTDPYAKEFGISVADSMAVIQGRILKPPTISYKGDKLIKIQEQSPGSWNNTKTHYVDGKEVKYWAVLDLANLGDREYQEIIRTFATVGCENGMRFTADPSNLWHQRSKEQTVNDDFKAIVDAYRNDGLNLQLILVILPFKGGKLYDRIKKMGDIEYKVPTQCVLKNTLYKGNAINFKVVQNICLKINSKLGGVNHVLAPDSRPSCLKRPIMIMGADVSHAAPESKGEKPSIAAVVGSMDPKASLYECQIRVQRSGQNEEIIQDMKDITKKLLMKFHATNKGRKPERIIMFRDGVSEGQFLKVLVSELTAMQQACKELQPDGTYNPQITYLVVQKRHHTRFFPNNIRNDAYLKNGNTLAGTVIDQGINHPTEGDFYLVSHEGIQGTSRPTHYQVLWDDADMSADELEILTYYLCHLYSRCTRSVSYPTPTYYSHLAADRARKHHNDMLERREKEPDRLLEQKEYNIMYFV